MNPNSTCLIIAEDSPESYSPAGERARHMALASSAFFSKTILLTSGKAKKRAKPGIDAKVLLYKTGVVRSIPFPVSALFDPIRLLAFFVYGLVLSTRYKPSHILASMPPIETGASAWFLTRLLHKKLVIDCRDDWESYMRTQLTRYMPERLMKPTFKFANFIYSFSTAVLVVTRTLGNIVRKRIKNSSLILVPNGADLLMFFCQDAKSRRKIRLKHSIPLNRVVLIYCGSANPYYRLDLIFLSAKSLPNDVKGKTFFVFYLYSEIERYRELKALLKISDDLVEIRGPLPRSDLSEVMAACDVGLVPFDDKLFLLYAMSTKLYEYLSVGLYVISSGPSGGELQSFFSQNPSCGIFVQPRVEDFVRVFLRIISSDYLFDDDSRNSRHSFIAKNYDRRKIMAKAMACLSSLGGVSK